MRLLTFREQRQKFGCITLDLFGSSGNFHFLGCSLSSQEWSPTVLWPCTCWEARLIYIFAGIFLRVATPLCLLPWDTASAFWPWYTQSRALLQRRWPKNKQFCCQFYRFRKVVILPSYVFLGRWERRVRSVNSWVCIHISRRLCWADHSYFWVWGVCVYGWSLSPCLCCFLIIEADQQRPNCHTGSRS